MADENCCLSFPPSQNMHIWQLQYTTICVSRGIVSCLLQEYQTEIYIHLTQCSKALTAEVEVLLSSAKQRTLLQKNKRWSMIEDNYDKTVLHLYHRLRLLTGRSMQKQSTIQREKHLMVNYTEKSSVKIISYAYLIHPSAEPVNFCTLIILTLGL